MARAFFGGQGKGYPIAFGFYFAVFMTVKDSQGEYIPGRLLPVETGFQEKKLPVVLKS